MMQSIVMGPATVDHGLKRKFTSDSCYSIKKARVEEQSLDLGMPLSLIIIDFAKLIEKDSVSEFSDGSISENTETSVQLNITSTATTPITPGSPKVSPRFPSDLKTHHCTFPDCDKAFNRPAKLSQHLRSHTNTRLFICPHLPCDKNFLRQTHLKHHVKSAHSNVRDHICDWDGCGKAFITATRLKRHRAAHEGREKFKCQSQGCNQVFRKHATLQNHVSIVHEGRKPYVCDMLDEEGHGCDMGFNTSSKLRSHQGRIHGGKRFWCSICCSTRTEDNDVHWNDLETDLCGFPTYTALQEHIKIDHPPTCTKCGLQCSSQRELKNHVEIRHGERDVDDRRTHLCLEPNCGRAFTKKGNLNVHIQSVHRSKKYVCGSVPLESLKNIGGWNGHNACGQSISTKGNLEEHIRKKHIASGQNHTKRKNQRPKQTKCLQKTVSTLTRLTGVGYEKNSGRPINCLFSDCSFRFSRCYDLSVHLQTRHSLAEQEVQALIPNREEIFGGPEEFDEYLKTMTSQEVEAEVEQQCGDMTISWMPPTQMDESIFMRGFLDSERSWCGNALSDVPDEEVWQLEESRVQ